MGGSRNIDRYHQVGLDQEGWLFCSTACWTCKLDRGMHITEKWDGFQYKSYDSLKTLAAYQGGNRENKELLSALLVITGNGKKQCCRELKT